MRIVSWNVNGLRTLGGYRPWFTHKTWCDSLDHLGGDIVCFQECKVTRDSLVDAGKGLGSKFCCIDGWQAFYNLHPVKGYSGTACYTRDEACRPIKMEEGITGRYAEEGGSKGSVSAAALGGIGVPLPEKERIGCITRDARDEMEMKDFIEIDQEGRAVVLDCGLFVLFNLYCPNETGPERRPYK